MNLNMKTLLITVIASLTVIACAKREEVHNLSVDEARRAKTYAESYFNQDHPGGVDASGQIVKKKGSFQACRPQDSNANGMVTCTGLLPNMQGTFTTTTRYCGYESGAGAVLECSDKDQK